MMPSFLYPGIHIIFQQQQQQQTNIKGTVGLVTFMESPVCLELLLSVSKMHLIVRRLYLSEISQKKRM